MDSNCKIEEELCKVIIIFIIEGDFVSGFIIKVWDVQMQAVFSLCGKLFNCYGLIKKVVYENEEFNFLQYVLNIEDGLDELCYNWVVIVMDVDVDGMYI